MFNEYSNNSYGVSNLGAGATTYCGNYFYNIFTSNFEVNYNSSVRLELCFRRINRRVINNYLGESGGRDLAVNLLKSSPYFEDKILAYGLKMDAQEYGGAYSYLDNIYTTFSDELDFIESSLIYNSSLQTGIPISESDLNKIYQNANERNPYAAFSESIYFESTGLRVDKPFIHLNSIDPRSKKEKNTTIVDFNAYPNPISNGQLTIELFINGTIDIIGVSGNQYYSNNLEKGNHTLTIENIKESLILIKFTDRNGNITINKITKL